MIFRFSTFRKPALLNTYKRLILSQQFEISYTMPKARRGTTDPLKVKSVNLLREETTKKHFTSDYETNDVVFRRGFPFKMMITLSRSLQANETLNFELRMVGSKRPMVHHGTLIPLPRIDPKPDEDVIGHNLLAAVGDIVTVEVYTSAKTTGIGKWEFAIRPKIGRKTLSPVSVTSNLIAIFNPWSKFDPVYMRDNAWKDEYVLNEEGLQFYGSHKGIGNMDWYFGQFEADVMKACLKLLHKDKIPYKDREDPVAISRHMSALVNSNDDDGVLVGNWSGDYEDGIDPSDWVGSVQILKKYVESGSPVQYGQCWVFSGVLTTVLRCLGIPTRSLTNFESAHDTESNLAIDYKWDKNGKVLEKDDSIWNFHVWNDVWMAREDLPEGYGGWQALDATPQELSGRKFQCGPMSLHAIKEGQLKHNYDGLFIYAEVNGAKRYWQEAKDGDGWVDVGVETAGIGQKISTKAIGSWEREDITDQYKYKEGSKEEELSFKIARKFGEFVYTTKKEVKQLLKFTSGAPDSVKFGEDISFTVKIQNLTKTSQNFFLNAVAKTMQYNGSIVKEIMDKQFSGSVAASKTQEYTLKISVKDYLPSVKGNNSIKLFFMGGVPDAQTFGFQEVIDFVRPTLKVEVPATAKLSKPVKVKVSFTNPLSVALEQCRFRFEGAGIKEAVLKDVQKVKPQGVCSTEVSIYPRKLGVRRLIVGFSSKQMQGLQGSAQINVS